MARFLGIDTSCYTTSAAVYDSSGELAGEERIVLSVKEGNRGLSQSQMVSSTRKIFLSFCRNYLLYCRISKE